MKFVINLLCLCAFLQANAHTVLRFQKHVSAHARYVGDLLRISPDKKGWSAIKLDSRPRENERISQQHIITWLQQRVGIFTYQWQGKKTVIVHSIEHSSAQELLDKAQTALTHHLQKQAYTHLVITPKSMPHDSAVSLSRLTVQLPKEYPIAKRVCVHLNYQKRSIPIWFAIKAYQSVLVAQRRLDKRSLVQATDFTLKKHDIAGLKNIPLTQFPKTRWLIQSLNKKEILTQNMLGAQPEIIQGQTVKVHVSEHGITITTDALAQDDGYKGQIIRMRNIQNNKFFYATVTAHNQAEIAA